jgi:hypothetical protein
MKFTGRITNIKKNRLTHVGLSPHLMQIYTGVLVEMLSFGMLMLLVEYLPVCV